MDLRLAFNEVSKTYDKLRPGYVPELYEDIINYSGINPGSTLLEIGIGTGQATAPFLETGGRLVAVELGSELAKVAKEKFKIYRNFEIVNAAFEDYSCAENSLDLIYSASAFHWIPEEVGYTKVFELLKSGGTFARFARHPCLDEGNMPLHDAIQELYAKYMPDMLAIPVLKRKKDFRYGEEDAAEIAALAKKYGFVDIEYKLYSRMRAFDAKSYSELIKTYSDHRAMGMDRLEPFAKKIEETINAFGSTFRICDVIDLQLARKP